MREALRSQEKLFILNQTPLFASISLKDKKFIAALSSITEYKKGDVIYRELDAPDAFYCVITGRVRVYIVRQGRADDLEYLKRGGYFGILSLLTGEPHSVTAEAVNDSLILKIPKDDFQKILKRIPALAIHFGKTLSRRLKRKDLREKKVFESTILSIFGTSNRIGVTDYVFNLAVGLKNQTQKKVILVEINRAGENILARFGAKGTTAAMSLGTPFFSEETVRNRIFNYKDTISIINVTYDPKNINNLVPIVSYLTNDYHYVLIDLPTHMEKDALGILRQSDMIHILSASGEEDLRLTADLMDELRRSSADIEKKIKIITSDYGVKKPAEPALRMKILDHEIFATLPDLTKPEHPESEYLKTIRRISRDIGGCLIGLALGSGAALGIAHVGVLKVIEAEGIPIDILVGTSMGALIGALWASGKNTEEIEKIVLEFRHKINSWRLLDLTIPRKGLIKGREVRRFLSRQFGNKTFYDLKMPFKVVACDIEKREEVVIDKGSLVDAIMASVSIPGVFEPVNLEGRLLVDGGIIDPLPTSVLMRLGVAKIIAVNTLPSPEDIQESKKKITNIFDIIVNSVQASEYLLAEMSCQDVDIALHPVLPTVDWYEFYEGSSVVKRGVEEALKYLPQLKELARP